MFIKSKQTIEVGDQVISMKKIVTLSGTFTPGHIFKVVGMSNRGYEVIDSDGNGANDAGFDFEKVK